MYDPFKEKDACHVDELILNLKKIGVKFQLVGRSKFTITGIVTNIKTSIVPI